MLPPSYNLKGLSCLQHVPNADAIVERIDLAATKATFFMRALGIPFTGEGIPTIDDIDAHIRKLVSDAVNEFHQAQQAAQAHEVGVESADAADDWFSVWVVPITESDNPPLHIEIGMMLC